MGARSPSTTWRSRARRSGSGAAGSSPGASSPAALGPRREALNDEQVARAAGGEAPAARRRGPGPGGRRLPRDRARRSVRRPAGGARRRRRLRCAALRAGAWGVLVAAGRARRAAGRRRRDRGGRPVAALGALARAWRRELGAAVIAVTGSVGKTSTKDLIAALSRRTARWRPAARTSTPRSACRSTLLAAPQGTEVLVLEMAMRGFGQIAELTAICRARRRRDHDIGPVHLEQVGSLEGVARAKGELLVGMRDGADGGGPGGRGAARAASARRRCGR